MQVDSPATAVEQLKEASGNNGDIDESLYSRQLYVLGHEAMIGLAPNLLQLAIEKYVIGYALRARHPARLGVGDSSRNRRRRIRLKGRPIELRCKGL